MKYFQKTENNSDWRKDSIFKTFFHNLEWEKFLAEQFSWLKFEHYEYRNKDNRAYLSLARVGKEKLISHPFCEYGGPFLVSGTIDGGEFTKNILEDFKDNIKISFHPYLLDSFRFSAETLRDTKRITYLLEDLDKKNEAQLLDSFRKTLCQSIKKAETSGIEVERCGNRNDLASLYDLYIKKSKQHRVPPYPKSFFDFFFQSKDAEIIVAKFKGRVIAGSVFLFYPPFIHYFLNASDDRFKDLFPNHLIVWRQIRHYAGRQFKFFDFGGTRKGSKLEVFKAGWGTKPYPIAEITNIPENKNLRNSKMRKMFFLMPDFLVKAMSPYLLKFKL